MAETGLATTITGGLGNMDIAPYAGEQSRLYTPKFKNNVIHLLQEKFDRVAGTCLTEYGEVSEMVKFPRMDASTAQVRTAKHQVLLPGATFGSTVAGDTAHSVDSFDERWAFPQEVWDAKLLGKNDSIRTAVDIQSAKVQSMAWAFARKRSQIVLAAAIGAAWEGPQGNLAQVAFPADNVIAHEGVGFRLAKVRRAATMMNYWDVPDEGRYLFYCAEQLDDALQWIETTSRDYTDLMALRDGKIQSLLGFTWIRLSKDVLPSTTDGGSRVRQVICWQREGVGRVEWRMSRTARIDELSYLHYDKQIYMSENYGAVRLEDKRVIRIDCVESFTPNLD